MLAKDQIDDTVGFSICTTIGNGYTAYGDIYVYRNKMIFFGEAYEKAYELQNKMNYYSVVCDNSICDFFSKYYKNNIPEQVLDNYH